MIPCDEILPGASIRCTPIEGVQYLSIGEFIMHMCQEDQHNAARMWREMSHERVSKVGRFLSHYQFAGQQAQPVITFPGAIQLAMLLPGEKAKTNRPIMTQILTRYFTGDRSLVQAKAVAREGENKRPRLEEGRRGETAALVNMAQTNQQLMQIKSKADTMDTHIKELTSEIRGINAEKERFRIISEKQTRAIAHLNAALRAKDVEIAKVGRIPEEISDLKQEIADMKQMLLNISAKLDATLDLF